MYVYVLIKKFPLFIKKYFQIYYYKLPILESGSHSERVLQPLHYPLMDASNVSPLITPAKSRLEIVQGIRIFNIQLLLSYLFLISCYIPFKV